MRLTPAKNRLVTSGAGGPGGEGSGGRDEWVEGERGAWSERRQLGSQGRCDGHEMSTRGLSGTGITPGFKVSCSLLTSLFFLPGICLPRALRPGLSWTESLASATGLT